jgi:hypothetical protein
MDMPARNAVKSAPLLRQLASILGPTASKSSLAPHIYTLGMDLDYLNVSRHVLYVNPPGYWFDKTGYYKHERFEGHRQEARQYFQEVVSLLREDDLGGIGGGCGPLLPDIWQDGGIAVDRVVENYVNIDTAVAGAYGMRKHACIYLK